MPAKRLLSSFKQASIARGIRGGAPGRQVQTRGRGTSTPSSSIPISSNRAVTRMPNAIMSRGVDSSSRARASILQSARQVGIQGGTFNTAGAHQLNFTFHLGDQSVEQNSEPLPPRPQDDRLSQDHMSTEGPHIRQQINRQDRDHSTTQSQQQTPPIQRSSDIYYRLLIIKGRGLPLWIPGPNQKLDIGYQRDGTTIGDVGIITASGSFDFLFNICVPHDHPFNPPELPENFSPLALLPHDVDQHCEFQEASFLSSSSVRSRSEALNGFTFESSASEGAILTMPVGANSEDVASIAKFRKYMVANAEHWYRYILDVRGREPQNGDVLLVTGWDKTTAWGMATFSKTTAEQEPFLLQFRPIDQGNAGITYGWEYSGFAEVRAGPGPREKTRIRMGDPSQDGVEYENQCLFIRTLTVDLQDKVWQKLASEFGLAETNTTGSGRPFDSSYSRPSREASDRSGGSTSGRYYSSAPGTGHHLVSSIEDIPALMRRNPEYLSRPKMIKHPTKGINEILLKLNPTAKMAIADDRDWISVLKEDDRILPPADELFKRILESHIVCFEEDAVFMQPRDLSSTSMPSKDSLISSGTDSITEEQDHNDGKTGMSYISQQPLSSSPSLEASSAVVLSAIVKYTNDPEMFFVDEAAKRTAGNTSFVPGVANTPAGITPPLSLAQETSESMLARRTAWGTRLQDTRRAQSSESNSGQSDLEAQTGPSKHKLHLLETDGERQEVDASGSTERFILGNRTPLQKNGPLRHSAPTSLLKNISRAINSLSTCLLMNLQMIALSVVDLASYGVGNKVSLVAENDDDRPSMPDHVPTLALRGRTLGFLGPRSKIRLASYSVLVHPLTEPLILLLIILNAAILTIQGFSNLTPNGQDTPNFRPGYLHSWENIILLMIFTLFTLEAFARICVTGFLFYPEVPTLALFSRHGTTPNMVQPTTLFSAGHSITHHDVITLPFNPRISDSYNKPRRPVPYLQHSWSKLDFIAIVSFWIMFTLGITGAEKDKSYIGVFMAMSVLRTARLLMITPGSATIMHSLRIARPLLASVAYLVTFVTVLFSIIGVQFFGGSLRKTCAVSPSPGQIPYLQTSQVCAGYINHATLNATSLKGYICPLGQLCMEISSSEGQFGGFNTIYSSFLQVAILATGKGWASLMYSIIDSELFVSSFFFILAVIILKLWLFNLFIAVTTHTFAAIRSETRRTAFGGVLSVATRNLQDDGWTSSDNRMTRPNTARTIYAKTEWCWIILAFVSLMLQATRTVNILPTHELMLRYSEVAIAIAFNFEIGLRLIATLPDWRSFFKHRNNWIDLILAVGSTMIYIPFIRHSTGYPWFSVFQLARFYRVILVVPFTEPLLMACFGNMHGLANMTLFFAIVNYVAALSASQFLQTELPFSNRLTSGETLNSFLGNYQTLSRNSWTGIFYDTSTGRPPSGEGVLALSFISARMLFANVIMLPMLVALINENFEVAEEQKKYKQASSYLQKQPQRGKPSGLNPFHWVSQLPWNLVFSVRKVSAIGLSASRINASALPTRFKRGLRKPWFMKPQQLSSKLTSLGTVLAADIETNVIPLLTLHHNQRNAHVDRLVDEMDDPLELLDTDLGFADITDVDLYERRAQKADFIRDHPAYDKVFWIIGQRNWLRRLCQKVVQPSTGKRIFGIPASPIAHFLFQLAILLAVIGSIVVEAVATPEYRYHYLQKVGLSSAWFEMAEVAFGFTLFLEFIIKVIADGFIFTPDAYLRSIWNCLDFIITIGIVTNVTMGVVFARRLGRFIQSLKALRVLRLITLIDKARNTFQAHIISGSIRILNAGIFATLLMIPYAVWSLNIFNGQINSCNEDTVSIISDCIGEYDNTVYDNAFAFPVPRVWDNSSPSTRHNFDSFPASLLALFEIMSSQGWVNVMDIATGITGRGEQQPNASTGTIFFFAIFKAFSLVISALFVSIFIRNFKSKTGTAFLTEAQRQWIDLQWLLQRQKPFKRHEARPTAPLRRWCFDRAVDKHGWWSRTMILLFFLHTVALLVQTSSKLAENPHPGFISLVIPTIYFTDVVIRSYGLGRRSFCSNGWNLFDVVVATGSFVTTLTVYFGHSIFYVRPLQQLFLVSIAFKLVQRMRSLDVVLETAISILPDILTLLGFWLIFLLFFGLLFMEVFGFAKWGGSETMTTNFSSFGPTLLMLASQSASEIWNQYMHDYSLVYPKCTSSAMGDADSDCGTAMSALILFISWNILNTYIFPNMFTGVVVEHFSHVFQASGVGHKAITKEQMQSFKKIWSEFSNSKTGYLERHHFVPFFQKLGGAFEVRIYPAEHSVRNILSVCKIPSDKAAEHSRVVDGVDLSKLQLLVAQVDYADIRQRKATYNRLYHEANFFQEHGRGISFTNMLLLLAHHKLIVDTEALLLEDLIHRNETNRHIADLVRLDRVRSFLKMVTCRRRFLTYLDQKKSARLEKTAESTPIVPSLQSR